MAKTFPRGPKMAETSLSEQNSRRYIRMDWEPAGFDRYQYNQALLRKMDVLGGIADQGGMSPDRYSAIGPLEEDYPIRS